jgi:hypothetical protein
MVAIGEKRPVSRGMTNDLVLAIQKPSHGVRTPLDYDYDYDYDYDHDHDHDHEERRFLRDLLPLRRSL